MKTINKQTELLNELKKQNMKELIERLKRDRDLYKGDICDIYLNTEELDFIINALQPKEVVSAEELLIIALKDQYNKLNEQEESFFIAGFLEAFKYMQTYAQQTNAEDEYSIGRQANVMVQFCECVKENIDGADVNGNCVHCGKKHNANCQEPISQEELKRELKRK